MVGSYSTEWMSHRKGKETKQQPGTAGPGNILGCCLVSLRFLCNIHSIHPVQNIKLGIWPPSYYFSKQEIIKTESSDDCAYMYGETCPSGGSCVCAHAIGEFDSCQVIQTSKVATHRHMYRAEPKEPTQFVSVSCSDIQNLPFSHSGIMSLYRSEPKEPT